MASRTITQITDDLDGSSEGVETVTFGLFGANYEIDLSPANQKKLEDALVPFLDKARKASPSARRFPARAATGRNSSGNGRAGGSGVDASAVRAWAQANNIEVSPRGRISGDVLEKYRAAGS